MTPRPDVVTLLIGLLLSGCALVALAVVVIGSAAWSVGKIAAPLMLIGIGVTGIVLTQRRSRPPHR